MTREGTYSLASQTLNQLQKLDRPVNFTMIFGHGPLAEHQRDRVDQLLESYRAANPRWIRIASLDPFVDLGRIEDLAKRVPDLAQLRGGGVLIEYGEGNEALAVVVRNQEMFEPIPAERFRTSSDRFESAFTGEDAITSALCASARVSASRWPSPAGTENRARTTRAVKGSATGRRG